MTSAQPGILSEETKLARYLSFSIDAEADALACLQDLVEELDTSNTVTGLGASLLTLLGKTIPGLHTMPAQSGRGIEIPSTPMALWFWLRGTDRGEIYHRSRQIESLLTPGFLLRDVVDSFQYDENRDLSGYEDGTENPVGNAAVAAAIVQDQGPGMNGSSFVAVQQWQHDMDVLELMSTDEQDDIIGRHISNNEEFDDAPESAHVKRAAQESYDPEAFILRRSMPWTEGMDAGLIFVAFGKSFDAFEAILHRMLGKEDGISDALFQFTRPITGAYYWCPPVTNGKLDLGLIDI